MSNVLDPSSILHTVSRLLPKQDTESANAEPLLRDKHDALAALAHAIMISVGFRLTSLGDGEHKVSTDQTELPQQWSAHGPHAYTFQYTHPQSSLTFMLKGVTLADKFIVHGLAIEVMGISLWSPIYDYLVEDQYTSPSFYPYSSSQQEPLVNGYISSSRLNDFINLFKINILQKLIPGLNKPGYEESQSATSTVGSQPNVGSGSNPLQETRPEHRPYGDIPRPPYFDDPLAGDDFGGPGNPFSVGGDDLNPLGHLRGPGRHNQGGGMFVGPDHPIFGGDHNRQDPSGGIFGGPQPLPR
ncbi:hypothetical protein NQZ79_g8080 [Umbelopsis isabellina]|nr:hypothetical protein NQZ79_g8080 [Umbelopsis isabellina]